MKYPSKELNDWCLNSSHLYQDENCDSVCECGIGETLKNLSSFQKSDLFVGLFWSIWIDQVFYYVAIPSRSDIYLEFRKIYPFPKIRAHIGAGMMNPFRLISGFEGTSDSHLFVIPDQKQILEGKKDFWFEVKDWLKFKGETALIEKMEYAFREDIELRFDKECKYLFE